MRTDIFIKTCSHDADYHRYCLESIEKFCSGFGGVNVVEGDHPKGYLEQQVVKLHADTYCPEADYILVNDSDTLFTEPVTPESFMRDGKPMWFYTPLESVSQDARKTWVPVMTDFMGQKPPAEFMRRQPFMFPTWILKEFREFCQKKRHVGITDYVMAQRQFSEYNCLGFYAWVHHRDAFSWVNTDEETLPLRVNQFWSHDPIEKNIHEIQQILA